MKFLFGASKQSTNNAVGNTIYCTVAAIALLVGALSANAQSFLTWRSTRGDFPYANTGYPSQFPNRFADGQFAFTYVNDYGAEYVVAREGIRLNSVVPLSEISQSVGDRSDDLPAILDFPESLYNSDRLIVVQTGLMRSRSPYLDAQDAPERMLSDGKPAYFIDNFFAERDGGQWCAFSRPIRPIPEDVKPYGYMICVGIANSPVTALAVLDSIVANTIGTGDFRE